MTRSRIAAVFRVSLANRVPQEHPTIARHFNVGFWCNTKQVPILFPALKRRAIFKKFLRDYIQLAFALILVCAAGVKAQTTGTLSDAEIKGRELARQLCDSKPTENYTNTGVMQIRHADGSREEFPIRILISSTETNWQACYETTDKSKPTKLLIVHNGESNQFFDLRNGEKLKTHPTDAFAGSDFWLGDLGLDFFRWPDQKILPKTTNLKRGRAYTLLQSSNSNPSANGYSRVVTWIDNESGGILEAKAYDARGEQLKEFFPKDLKKVNGQWELQSMEMDNVQTDSRTQIEFDLKKD